MPLRLSMIGPMPPFRGGVSRFAVRAWEVLDEAGHTVQPIGFRRHYPSLWAPRRAQHDPSPRPTPGPVLDTIDSIGPWTWRATARTIADFGPDLLLFHHSSAFFAPAYRSILRHVRRADPAIRSLALVHRAIPNRRSSMDKWLNRGFLVRNDGYIVLNEEVERDLWQLGLRAPIRQIPHPIFDRFGDAQPRAEARDRLGIASDTPLLLFFGSVRPHKGLNVLLESVAVARRRLPELRLIIAGEFDESEAGYRSQIADLGIARAVDIRNEYVPDADVATLFGASDAVVQPGVKAPQRGIAPVAFHFGRPLILTDLGDFARVVQECDGGLVVPPGDPDALAEAIVTFFIEDLADDLAAGVRARRHEFSWDGLVEAIEELDEAVR